MAPYIGNMDSTEPTMSHLPTDGPAAGGDEFDDLFDYDVGGADDPFRDLDLAPKLVQSKEDLSKTGHAGAGLGIDEQVEVTKKPRAPRVKLDENRLLSQAGIPKLRKRAKDLKFKGRGHEYSDAARLLSFYQLWLDDLFPKAKFLDALAMVEKLGHKRRMQILRMDWINEGKPRSSIHENSIFDEPILPPGEGLTEVAARTKIAPIFESTVVVDRLKTPDVNDMEEDIYNATPKARKTQTVEPSKSLFGGENNGIFEPKETAAQEEDPDDLDALLAEAEMEQTDSANATVGTKSNVAVPEPNFDDDMEAMGEMDEMW